MRFAPVFFGTAAVTAVVIGVGLFFEGERPVKFLPGDQVVMNEPVVGCGPEAYDRLTDFAAAHDQDVFNAYVNTSLKSGRCVLFRPGSAAQIEKVELFEGSTQMRQIGETKSWLVTTSMLNISAKKTGRVR